MLAYCHGQGWVRTRTRSPFIGMSLCPWRYLLDTAISLKKGNFNTPSVFSLLKKKTAALIVISKPPLGLLYSVRRVKILPPNNGFFISRWAVNISFLSGICFYSFKWNTYFFGNFFN